MLGDQNIIKKVLVVAPSLAFDTAITEIGSDSLCLRMLNARTYKQFSFTSQQKIITKALTKVINNPRSLASSVRDFLVISRTGGGRGVKALGTKERKGNKRQMTFTVSNDVKRNSHRITNGNDQRLLLGGFKHHYVLYTKGVHIKAKQKNYTSPP